MFNRLNNLSFVIGLFFTIVSLVLLANIFVMNLTDWLTLYTTITFLIFGLLMMFAGTKKTKTTHGSTD